jgi:NADH-quinone oxidoreductase subunit G
LGLSDFNYNTSEEIRDEFFGAGINDLSAQLNNVSEKAPQAAVHTAQSGVLQRVADVPIYFADAIVRRSEALMKTDDAQVPKAWLSQALATKLDIVAGDQVKVTQGSGSALLLAAIQANQPINVVRVAAAHMTTSTLGGMFDAITIEKVSSKLESNSLLGNH